MKVAAALFCERDAQRVAIKPTTLDHVADDRTETHDEQDIYTRDLLHDCDLLIFSLADMSSLHAPLRLLRADILYMGRHHPAVVEGVHDGAGAVTEGHVHHRRDDAGAGMHGPLHHLVHVFQIDHGAVRHLPALGGIELLGRVRLGEHEVSTADLELGMG